MDDNRLMRAVAEEEEGEEDNVRMRQLLVNAVGDRYEMITEAECTPSGRAVFPPDDPDVNHSLAMIEEKLNRDFTIDYEFVEQLLEDNFLRNVMIGLHDEEEKAYDTPATLPDTTQSGCFTIRRALFDRHYHLMNLLELAMLNRKYTPVQYHEILNRNFLREV